MHPFKDGNGRSGRIVLAVQFEKIFGVIPSFTNQQGYRSAIRESSRRELAPLINYLGASVDLPRIQSWKSPFQVQPRFLETATMPSLPDDLDWSRATV